MTLKDIKSPADIKDLSSEALKSIASEMRKALITKLSQTGGHVAPKPRRSGGNDSPPQSV